MADRRHLEKTSTIVGQKVKNQGDIRAHYVDGEPAHTVYIPNATSVTFTPEMGLPIITTKPVASPC